MYLQDTGRAYLSSAELEAIRSGDEACFEKISHRFKDMAFARYYTSYTTLEREDFWQEALLCLHKAILTYKPDREASFTTYYHHLLRNWTINIQRQQTAQKRYSGQRTLCFCEVEERYLVEEEQAVYHAAHHSPEAELAVKDVLARFTTALSRLEQAALLCHLTDGDIKKLAQDLKVREKTIQNAYYRSRQKIKALVREHL